MKHLTENEHAEQENNNKDMNAQKADPSELERLQKMGEKIHLVLRMAAMNMLKKAEDGFVMCVPQMPQLHLQAQSLFEAYRALEDQYAGDWDALDQALKTPWVEIVIQMVLEPQRYIAVWRELRMTLITEALPLLRQYADEEKIKEESKYFTLLGLQICDKVIKTLAKDDEPEKSA